MAHHEAQVPAREEDVLNSEIPVVYPLSMAVRQAIQQLREQAPGLGLRYLAALAPASQASSTRMLHLSGVALCQGPTHCDDGYLHSHDDPGVRAAVAASVLLQRTGGKTTRCCESSGAYHDA